MIMKKKLGPHQENTCLLGMRGQRPRSDCTCTVAQSDHGLRCPLIESEQSQGDFAHAQDNLNLLILRMFEDVSA